MRKILDLETWQARLFMVFDGRFKLMHSAGGHAPMLFDLLKDPNEFTDLGTDKQYKEIIDSLYSQLNEDGIYKIQSYQPELKKSTLKQPIWLLKNFRSLIATYSHDF